jgi:hypothetical protein
MSSYLDDATFEVDAGPEDGTQVAMLILHGDLVESCETYLENEEATSMSFTISRSVAESLVTEIGLYL